MIKWFKEAGIRPKSKRGQNFLIELNLLDLLFKSGNVGPNDVVLEVGTGTGSLTALLAGSAARVVSVEVDPQMHQLARESLEGFDNLTLLRQDVLKNKNTLDSRVLECVREQLAEDPSRTFKLVANLPYSVATPIISNLLADTPVPSLMTVTIQKELADRITAKPRTKDYGALSIWMQSQCDAETVR
ncbi:MAG: methyltransferase domain-containing protein, partial [Planctomycetales bacterium]